MSAARIFTSKREREPIAVTGIGCRFPGGANDACSYWELLTEGKDAITEIPTDRWNIDEYYHPKAGVPGKTYSRWGGFVEGIDLFEPEFFGMSPREASQTDPQQRLLLEVAWEALEDGGQIVERLAGSDTGVFIGISTFDYAQLQGGMLDKRSLDAYSATGGALSIAANRISYFLGTRGPSIAVDTACSSALVATDLACRSIWSGECDLALAGGVNVIISPATFIAFCAAGMLSPDGRCKSFDARANGFVRGEGAGVVVLKRLSRAAADRDRIYAVIVGSAVNQDGRTGGIALPSQAAQEALLTKVYQDASVEPSSVHYVEAHGTGTEVGDPIEAGAIGRALSRGRSEENPCVIGSVKTNIGHLEAAAGIAGLIKTALVLKHRTIPPNLHFETPNPLIPFKDLRLRVATTLEPWPDGAGPAIAGVNSFGFGGTNAHIVMTECPEDGKKSASKQTRREVARSPILFPVSAATREELDERVRSYRDFVKDTEKSVKPRLKDLAYTAGLRRSHLAHRLAMVVGDVGELQDRLEAFLGGEERAGMSSGRRSHGMLSKVVFVFSGQGPQWWGMGRELFKSERVFRNKIETCDRLLRKYADWSLVAELHKDAASSRLQETAIAQPALFAVQVSLVEVWRSLGVQPDAVVGHSVGEVAAAHVAGALDLENAIRVIFHRGRCMDCAPARGKMLAVDLPETQALEAIAGYGNVALAAVNSPCAAVLSGDPQALNEICDFLEGRGVLCRFLQVEYAFHTPQMEPIRDSLLSALSGLDHKTPSLPMISTVTGKPVEGREFTEDYWWQNVRQRVRFSGAIHWLMEKNYDLYVEVSPHPVLAGAISECLLKGGRSGVALPSLRRDQKAKTVMLGSLGRLYTFGHPVAWQRILPRGGECVQLPRYPWQRQRYWSESERSRDLRLAGKKYPMLGRRLDSPDPSWEIPLDKRIFSFLEDHRVQGQAVVPAAAYVEVALEAGRELLGAGVAILEEMRFQKALFLADGDESCAQLNFHPADGAFAIHSKALKSDPDWILHATGYLRAQPDLSPPENGDIQALKRKLTQEVSSEYWYSISEEVVGLRYGPSFRGIERVWRRDGEVLARIGVPGTFEAENQPFCIHPALLDACFQLLPGAVPTSDWDHILKGVLLPVQIARARLFRSPDCKAWAHILMRSVTPRVLEGDIRVYDDDGKVLVELDGFRCQIVGMRLGETVEDWFYEVQWRRKGLPDLSITLPPADHLPSTRAIADNARRGSRRSVAASGDSAALSEIEEPLNGLALAYVARGMRHLGWPERPGDQVRMDALVRPLDGRPDRRNLARRLAQMLERSGYIGEAGPDQWIVSRLFSEQEPERLLSSLLSGYPAFVSELWLVARFGSNLAAVLQGEDPFGGGFSEAAVSMLEHFYLASPSRRPSNEVIENIVRMALDCLSPGGNLRVLEIGGGVGGVAAHLLPKALADHVEYVVSDIPGPLFEKTEHRLRHYPFVRFQALDLERDPLAQGFESHSFDMILVHEGYRRSHDPQVSLNGIRELLSSRGLVVLKETEASQSWLQMISALSGRWMRFGDLDIDSETCAAGHWKHVLEKAGMSDVERIVSASPVPCSEVVLVARGPRLEEGQRAVLPKASGPAMDGPAVWLIFSDQTGVGQSLSELLERNNQKCVLVVPGEAFKRLRENCFQISPDDSRDMEQLVQSVFHSHGVSWRGVIHLWSLDSPTAEKSSPASLERAEILGCRSALHLLQSLDRVERKERAFRLILVTRGAQIIGDASKPPSIDQSLLTGMGRVIANEFPDLRCKLIDLDRASATEQLEALFSEVWIDDHEDEVALRYGARFVPRLERTRRPEISSENARSGEKRAFGLKIPAPGSMDQLVLQEVERRPPGRGQVEIEVHAAALNFRDVLKALGLYPMEGKDYMILGDECSGRIVAIGTGVKHLKVGDEVIALAPASFGCYATTRADLVISKPSQMTFEEAVTMPVAFLTAYYALSHIARLRSGERVLIHSATGGVGLAALQIAHRAGAEIFATAGNPEKREFLQWMGVHHVLDSRSLSFADQVMEITDGRGVDVILNSLGGRAIAKGLSCLAPYGRFLELGKRDIYQDSKLGLWAFRKNLSFFAIDLGALLTENRPSLKNIVREFSRHLQGKKFQPLPHRVFPIPHVVDAFRHMAQARHIGKIVISMRDPDLRIQPMDRVEPLFRSDASYLITGGLGGIGLAVARWIVENGGRNLVLMGRSGAATDVASKGVMELIRAGARVEVMKADVSKARELERAVAEMDRTMPPLKGIFHTAMVLDDGILLQLDRKRFRDVLAPKVDGTWNLHSCTLDKPLDFFVLFSSVSSLIGNHGQANYVAANAFLDAFAHYRRAQGLPAITVNWGHLAEVGYVSRNQRLGESLTRRGIEGIGAKQAMESLGLILRRSPVQIGVLRVDWQKFSRSIRGGAARRVSSLIQDAPMEPSGPQTGARIKEVLLQAQPDARQKIVEDYVREQVAKVLGTAAGKLDTAQPLSELGLDSLMAIELKNRIESDLTLSLPTGKLVQGPNIQTLSTEVVALLGGEPASSDGKIEESQDLPEETAPSGPNLVLLRGTGMPPPLFCVHPVGGKTDIYRHLAGMLSSDLPVYGVESSVLNGSHRIEEIALGYTQAIYKQQSKGPYYLLGFSLGGFIAMAMAHFLEGQRENVAFVGLVDCDIGWTDPSIAKRLTLRNLISETYNLVQKETGLLKPVRLDQLAEETITVSEEILSMTGTERIEAIMGWLADRKYIREGLSHDGVRDYLITFDRHLTLIENFDPPVIRAPLFIWRAEEGLSGSDDKSRDWTRCTTAAVVERTIAGSHYSIMYPPSVATLAEDLDRSMRAIRAS